MYSSQRKIRKFSNEIVRTPIFNRKIPGYQSLLVVRVFAESLH